MVTLCADRLVGILEPYTLTNQLKLLNKTNIYIKRPQPGACVHQMIRMIADSGQTSRQFSYCLAQLILNPTNSLARISSTIRIFSMFHVS